MSEGSWVTASCNDVEFAIVFVFDNVIDNVKRAIMFFDNNDVELAIMFLCDNVKRAIMVVTMMQLSILLLTCGLEQSCSLWNSTRQVSEQSFSFVSTNCETWATW